MKQEFKIFSHEMFGDIRTMTDECGETYFVGKDVAKALGYKNSRDALNKHVDSDDKGVAKCDTLGGEQNLVFVNESGLYSLILASKLPQAKAFVINRDGIGLYNENDYCFTAFNYEDYGLGRLSSVRQLALVGLYFSQTHKDFSCKTDFDRFYTPGHSVTYYGLGGVHVGHTSGTYSSRLNSYVFYRNSPELTA